MEFMFTFMPLVFLMFFMAVPVLLAVVIVALIVNHRNKIEGAGGPGTGESRKLYKSDRDKMLAGVCGGIAEYFAIDSTLVRIALVFFTICGGSGILLYIIALIAMPSRPAFS